MSLTDGLRFGSDLGRVAVPPVSSRARFSSMRSARIISILLVALTPVGCTTSAAPSGSVQDAAILDSAVDTTSAISDAPGLSTIPDADEYLCEAGLPGSKGCPAATGDPNAVYPEGCVMARPVRSTYGDGPITCTCQPDPVDGSLSFMCFL
jgi:hypothetical protein